MLEGTRKVIKLTNGKFSYTNAIGEKFIISRNKSIKKQYAYYYSY